MKKCELCNSVAKMYCESDQALLCWDCDSKVHGANFLVAKHLRTLLCHLCQSPTPWNGSGPKLGPTVSVCDNCVNRNASREERNNEGPLDEEEEGDEDEDDEDDDLDEEDADDDDNSGGDEENQVVPWSSNTPPVSSSSTSEECSNRVGNIEEEEDGPSQSRKALSLKRMRESPAAPSSRDGHDPRCSFSTQNSSMNLSDESDAFSSLKGLQKKMVAGDCKFMKQN